MKYIIKRYEREWTKDGQGNMVEEPDGNWVEWEEVQSIVALLECGDKPQIIDGLPRRCRADLHTPAETAIYNAIKDVEGVGAHPLLTDAVILLGRAKEKVADYVESAEALRDHQAAVNMSGETCACCFCQGAQLAKGTQ